MIHSSAARKRNLSAPRMRKSRARLKNKLELDANDVLRFFPMDRLKTLNGDKTGVANFDYGGNYKSLNFSPNDGKGVGKLSIGFLYDTKQKEDTYKRKVCQDSEQCMEYLLAVRKSLLYFVPASLVTKPVWETMRVTAIRGAKTVAHTDDMRGYTDTFVMFHEKEGGMRYRIFPAFKCSVAYLFGKKVIPMEYREGDFLKVYAYAGRNKTPLKLVLKSEMVWCLKSCGEELPYAIAGIRREKIQIVPHDYIDIIDSSTDLETKSMESVLSDAGETSSPLPRIKWKFIGRDTNKWYQFSSWKYMHEYCKFKNEYVPRTHVYFRQIRSVCCGKNFGQGNKKVHFLTDETMEEVSNFFDKNVVAE